MVRPPQSLTLGAQPFLVEFADPFEDLPQLFEVLQLPANLRDLLEMETDLRFLGSAASENKSNTRRQRLIARRPGGSASEFSFSSKRVEGRRAVR